VSPAPDVLVRSFLLYVCLPLWVVFGFCDYLCHRASGIEKTTGLRESLLHAAMGGLVGVPLFLALFCEVTAPVLAIMLFFLSAHEWVAHRDVSLALNDRKITIWEMHAHSFLEVIPFVAVVLVAILRWDAVLDLLRLDLFKGGLHLRAEPLARGYIQGYAAFMLAVGILPYLEELWRCWRTARTFE
jgi:membrane-associated HD superfamily phosphohydrolase